MPVPTFEAVVFALLRMPCGSNRNTAADECVSAPPTSDPMNGI
jgi:hypothetical protein